MTRTKDERSADVADAVLDAVAALVLVLDPQGRVVFFNRACRSLAGTKASALTGRQPWLDFVPGDEHKHFDQALVALRAGQTPDGFEAQWLADGDASRSLWWSARALDGDGPGRFVITGIERPEQDSADRRSRFQERRLQHAALHDKLTGLPTRLLFNDRLKLAIRRCRRSDTTLALLLLDLDGFKYVNDVYGHERGDALLKVVADRLRRRVRAGDTVARLGGDEFALILENLDEPGDASVIAQKVVERLAAPAAIGGHELSITTSIGITTCPQDGTDVDTLVKNADATRCLAQQSGKGTFRYFTKELEEQRRIRAATEQQLSEAITGNQLRVHYQAQVDPLTAQVIGIEALVRWQHPEHGMMPPGMFIPVAEDSGLIAPMTDWIAAEVCRQGSEWQRAGRPKVPMAINISARHFREGGLRDAIERALDQSGFDPCWLELELTESAVVGFPERAIETLGQLSKMGVTISLDDFGTGYSSMIHLREFPISKLKIDRSFVMEIGGKQTGGEGTDRIVKAMVHLGKDLGLSIIAEGVETEEQRKFLGDAGCTGLQGYLFGRPAGPGEFWKGHE